MNDIVCLVCHAVADHSVKSIHRDGFRLAKSRPGGYTCGAACDKVIEDYDELHNPKKRKKKNVVTSPT